ncbi:tetratricopeptide repeat protein [Maribellus sediminis]|uniref:tetratricopeptide repeat protein n=1 Tax=Maribellus sediminis TaxID=2696285 RepID=UPI001431A70A|nr:tetratricopeptide repeat protein [Maribellus sediminis]
MYQPLAATLKKTRTTNNELKDFKQNTEELILEISEKIKKRETAIFCGAGISYNSGLPLVNDLIKYVLNSFDVEDADSNKILNSDLPFESFIQTLADEVNIEKILDIFAKGSPNINHKLIAGLIQKGLVKTILTTNFDTLIEKSLNILGLIKGVNFQVYSSENEFEKIDWESDTIKIIKIHGCVSDKEKMAITMELVAKGTNIQNKNNVVSSFFSNTVNPSILVLGYSCSDLFDISPQIESISNDMSQIFFLEHVVSDSEPYVEDISIKSNKNPFKKFIGQRLYMNADKLIKNLWDLILVNNYEYSSSNISWKLNIDTWLEEAIKYSLGIKNQISARLFYDIGEYEIAIKRWEQGLSIAQSENNQLFFYSQLGNLGMAFNALGKYTDAKRCLEESSKACRDIEFLQGETAQLQALGNIYRNLGDFDSAIKVYNRAVFLAGQEDVGSLCNSLGNLASIFTQKEQPDEAIKVLEQGLILAKEIGDKQSEGSMLCSIGVAYSQKGNNPKAIQCIQESINITKQIGDRQGECMAFLNLSNVNLRSEEYDSCIHNATISLRIAQSFNLKQSVGSAYYNIGGAYFFKGDAKSAIPNIKKAISVYAEIYGNEHRHTLSAIKLLTNSEIYLKRYGDKVLK